MKFFSKILMVFFCAQSFASGSTALGPNKAYLNIVENISRQLMIDPSLVSAVITCESDWRPTARSYKGALGLMQLMPATARNWGVTDPFDPYQNILAGSRHLKYLLELLDQNVPLVIAAYHAGEGRILKDGTVPSIKETQDYVRAVQSAYEKFARQRRYPLYQRPY